jgi:hypothetical protein
VRCEACGRAAARQYGVSRTWLCDGCGPKFCAVVPWAKPVGPGLLSGAPGPIERRRRSQLMFRLRRRWPKAVIAERLSFARYVDVRVCDTDEQPARAALEDAGASAARVWVKPHPPAAGPEIEITVLVARGDAVRAVLEDAGVGVLALRERTLK